MNWKQKLVVIYFIILPFVDLITSLTTRLTDSRITLGIVIRGLTVILGLFYVLFISKSKHRKKSILYFCVLVFFAVAYFLTKIDICNLNNLINEIIYAFKYLYFPIMLICFYILFSDLQIDNNIIKKIFLINCIAYSMLIIIPYILGTGFNSYIQYYMEGTNGWFYSANETGTTLTLLSISIYNLMDNSKKWKILFALPILFAISLIGTKVSFLGICIILFVEIGVFIIKNKDSKFLLPVILITFFVLCNYNSSVVKNINVLSSNNVQNNKDIISNDNYNNYFENSDVSNIQDNQELISDNDNKNENSKIDVNVSNDYKTIDELIKNKFIKKSLNLLLSGRENFFVQNFSVYKQSGIKNILFGLSWSNREKINYNFDKKLIEMDFFDILIHYGILGLLIYLIPLIYYIYLLLKNMKFIDLENSLYIISFILGMFISMLAGHVLGAPSVSTYLILIVVVSLNNIKTKNKI